MQRFGGMELSESPFPFDRKNAKNSESAGPETSFMKAVYKDSKAEFLAQAKRLVQASSEPLDGATVSKLLHLCCKCDSAECASALLGGELGTIPSVDELDDSLNSPLHTAAMADAARCVDVLLKKGARTDMRNCDGQLAVDLSLSDKR